MKRERTMTKRQRRNVDLQFEELGEEAHQLVKLAAESLGFTPEQLAAAENDVTEASDMIQVRVIEMLDHVHGGTTPDSAAALAEIERRRGAGFLQRVAATGKSAKAAALALLAVVSILATGAVSSARPGAPSSHKIQWGQLCARVAAALRKMARDAALLKNATRWRGTRGGWLQSCARGSRRRSSSGRGVARASWPRQGSWSPSSSASISRRSTRANWSAPGSPSTPSDGPAEPWSVRRTLPSPVSPRCASSIGDSASRVSAATHRGR